MTLLTPQMRDLLTDGFQHIIDETEFPRWNPIMGQIFREMNSTKPDENVSEITGYGLMSVKSEAGPLVYDDVMQAFATQFDHVEYVLASEVSEIMLEDDQYGKIEGLPDQLFRSFDETVEVIAANHFNRAENTSYLGGDGKPLASLTHPLKGGGNFANRPTTTADLSTVSYRQARVDIASWTDHRGKKLRFRPKAIMFPTEIADDVEVVFGSPMDPNSANNAINPANSKRLQQIENPYLTSATQWTILCEQHYMVWYWRRKIRTGEDTAFNGSYRFKVDFRASSGWWSPFGVYVNAGG